jgi:hypothetical protein
MLHVDIQEILQTGNSFVYPVGLTLPGHNLVCSSLTMVVFQKLLYFSSTEVI